MLIPESCRNMLIKYNPPLSTNRNVNGFNNSVVKRMPKGITRIGNRNVNHPKWCIPSIMTLACQSRKGTILGVQFANPECLLHYYRTYTIANICIIYICIFFWKLISWSSFSTKAHVSSCVSPNLLRQRNQTPFEN